MGKTRDISSPSRSIVALGGGFKDLSFLRLGVERIQSNLTRILKPPTGIVFGQDPRSIYSVQSVANKVILSSIVNLVFVFVMDQPVFFTIKQVFVASSNFCSGSIVCEKKAPLKFFGGFCLRMASYQSFIECILQPCSK